MKLLLSSLETYFRNFRKSPLLLILFFIFTLTLIAFVIYIFMVRPEPLPAGVVISNVTSNTATVSYVTREGRRGCALVYSWRWLPQVKLVCDESGSVHRLDFFGLKPSTTYQMLIGHSLYWWNASSTDANPALDKKKIASKAPLPLIQTLSKDMIDNQKTMTMTGRVEDDSGLIQPGALVVVSKAGSDAVMSTRANELGNFSLIIPVAIPTNTFGVSVWSETGFITTSITGVEVINGPVLLRVEKYAY